jgi:predicted aspartyl protease
MSGATLKMDMSPGLVMVDIGIWNKNKGAFSKLSITVDTGASVTTISTDILYRAGYDVTSGITKRITTASGIEYVKEITVENIKLENTEIGSVRVYAHTFPQESFSSGVLGLNILSMFDMNILFSKGLIELTKLASQ